ncbi:hypothetical protein GCM10023168_11680 [Fodinibacter luteus]|uniref:Soluble ligand binding domain-containing protein n=1 Tax=Fodinibacter luteus TaxID=552064 RepID=A0ABP8K7W1_9MICO
MPTELDLAVEPAARRSGAPDNERRPPGRPHEGRPGRAVEQRPGHRRVDDRGEDVPRGSRHARVDGPRGWVRLPVALVGARWQPGRAAVLGVVVVAVLAVAVFGLRVAWARSAGEGTVIAPGGGSRAGPTGLAAGSVPVGVTPSAGGAVAGAVAPAPGAGPDASGAEGGPGRGTESGGAGGAAGGAAGRTAGVVVVHVVGQVRRPGVLELPIGSRVSEAVEAAGGPTKDADLARLNLARVLVDGEQVRVPAPGDPVDTGAVAGPGPGPVAPGGGAGGLVPLNTADLAALDTLPGVGPVLAQRIVDWRTAHGRFTSVDELGEVSGIGEKLLAQLTPLVRL